MVTKKDKQNTFKPSTIIIIRYSIVVVIIVLLLTILLPILLNYPPGSINTAFDIEMSYISYYQQYSIIGLLILLLVVVIAKVLLKDIDSWYKDPGNEKFKDKTVMNKIRLKCFNLPYIIFGSLLIVPVLGVILVLNFTGSHFPIMIIKIVILVLSFAIIYSIFTFIVSKGFYNQLLIDTFEESSVLRNEGNSF